MNRALCELGEAKPPLDNHSPVCQLLAWRFHISKLRKNHVHSNSIGLKKPFYVVFFNIFTGKRIFWPANSAFAYSHLFVRNEDMATVIQDQVWFVRQAVLFVNEREDIRFEDGRVDFSLLGISLQWDAEMISDEDGKVIFFCR